MDCLDTLDQVDGRLERIDEGQPFNVFVDFAHTPDGLQKVFEYAKLITQPQRKIIAVFAAPASATVINAKFSVVLPVNFVI